MQKYYTNVPYLKKYRRKLRQASNYPEDLLWWKVNNKQLGAKFRRQHSINNYILDFYVPSIKLCIEIDGNYHDSPEMIIKDTERDAFLNSIGIKVIRFSAREIFQDLDTVTEEIYNIVNRTDAAAPPLPLLQGGEN